jgi:hypothetical protein
VSAACILFFFANSAAFPSRTRRLKAFAPGGKSKGCNRKARKERPQTTQRKKKIELDRGMLA